MNFQLLVIEYWSFLTKYFFILLPTKNKHTHFKFARGSQKWHHFDVFILNIFPIFLFSKIFSKNLKMPCCVGFSRILLLLLSVVFLFVGFTLACLVLWVRYDEKLEPEMRQILLLTNTSVSVPELDETKHTFRQAVGFVFYFI